MTGKCKYVGPCMTIQATESGLPMTLYENSIVYATLAKETGAVFAIKKGEEIQEIKPVSVARDYLLDVDMEVDAQEAIFIGEHLEAYQKAALANLDESVDYIKIILNALAEQTNALELKVRALAEYWDMNLDEYEPNEEE